MSQRRLNNNALAKWPVGYLLILWNGEKVCIRILKYATPCSTAIASTFRSYNWSNRQIPLAYKNYLISVMSLISDENVYLTRHFSTKPKITKKTNLFRISLLILFVLQIPCILRNVNVKKDSYWNALKMQAANPSVKLVPTCQYRTLESSSALLW